MPRKKKAEVTEKTEEKEIETNEETTDDDDVVDPGDCIGNYLEGDNSCELCEIADTCKVLTENKDA